MNRGVSSIQKTLKKYGPLRTHSGDIVSFRENKIGHRSSENGAMHDIDFGDVLSTPAPVAASVATKKTHKKEKTQLQTFFSARFSGFFHRLTELGASFWRSLSLCWGGSPFATARGRSELGWRSHIYISALRELFESLGEVCSIEISIPDFFCVPADSIRP